MQLVFEQRAPEFFLNQTLALRRLLPVRKSDLLYDFVDISHDALNDDVRILAFGFVK